MSTLHICWQCRHGHFMKCMNVLFPSEARRGDLQRCHCQKATCIQARKKKGLNW